MMSILLIFLFNMNHLRVNLSAYPSGLLVFENVEGEGVPQHMKNQTKEDVGSFVEGSGDRQIRKS